MPHILSGLSDSHNLGKNSSVEIDLLLVNSLAGFRAWLNYFAVACFWASSERHHRKSQIPLRYEFLVTYARVTYFLASSLLMKLISSSVLMYCSISASSISSVFCFLSLWTSHCSSTSLRLILFLSRETWRPRT